MKTEYSALYDHRKNILVGLPEHWGTWRRPMVTEEEPEGAPEPSSAITEGISIGTLSIYSLYHESSLAARSPLRSPFIPGLGSPTLKTSGYSREEGQEHVKMPRSPSLRLLSKASTLVQPGATIPRIYHSMNSPEAGSNSDLMASNESSESQVLVVPPRWKPSLAAKSIQLTPRHLLPRRSTHPLPPCS